MAQFLIFLQKSPFNLILFFAVIISGGMLIFPLINRFFRQSNEVGTLEAIQLINRRDAVVVDVREAGDYASGHIMNAKNIPEAQLGERLKELEKFKSRPIIINCNTGNRSAIASGVLRRGGFNEVFSLRGGVSAWRQANMPLEK